MWARKYHCLSSIKPRVKLPILVSVLFKPFSVRLHLAVQWVAAGILRKSELFGSFWGAGAPRWLRYRHWRFDGPFQHRLMSLNSS